MGRLVAGAKQSSLGAVLADYETRLLRALSRPAGVPRHVNVLQHILGFFKKRLSADEKQEMLDVIERYRAELVPLIVPVTLLNHYARKWQVPYLTGQFYLNPHPLELKLRNHA